MDACAFHRHEADPPRHGRLRYVVDGKSGSPVALGSIDLTFGPGHADNIPDLTAVISALVGKFRRREHVLGVHDQKQMLMRL